MVSLRRNRADALDGIASDICADIRVTIGLSSPFTDIADCSKARAQAQVAASACSTGRPTIRYDRDVMAVLLASSPDAAASVVTATLGPVLELPIERREPILTAVYTWLQRGQSVRLPPTSCIVTAIPSTTGCAGSPNSPDGRWPTISGWPKSHWHWKPHALRRETARDLHDAYSQSAKRSENRRAAPCPRRVLGQGIGRQVNGTFRDAGKQGVDCIEVRATLLHRMR